MKFLARLTLFDVVLLAAFVVVGIIWIGQRFAGAPATSPSELAGETIAAGPAPTAAEATDAAVDAIVAADGIAFVDALIDVARAAADAGNTEAFEAVVAFANAFAMGDNRTYQEAGQRLEEMSGDPIVEPLTRRISAALVSTVMALPAGPAPEGTEWAQLLVLPAGDADFSGVLLGTVTWTRDTNAGAVGTIDIPDGPLAGTVTITPANAIGYTLAIDASFAGPSPPAPIAGIDTFAYGDGTLAYDEAFEADLTVEGPWHVAALLRSASARDARVLRTADTLAWHGVLADGSRLVIRIVLGDSGRAALSDTLRAAGL